MSVSPCVTFARKHVVQPRSYGGPPGLKVPAFPSQFTEITTSINEMASNFSAPHLAFDGRRGKNSLRVHSLVRKAQTTAVCRYLRDGMHFPFPGSFNPRHKCESTLS